MTIKRRFLLTYVSTIMITLFSLFLIFSFISYSSYGSVPSITKIYRIFTIQRPLTSDEKESFTTISSILKRSPHLLESPFNPELKSAIRGIEGKNLNVVIRKGGEFTYYSPELVLKSLHAHAPDFDLNNFDPTGTIDNNGRFFHYIKTDFQFRDGAKGSFYILKRESNLFEFFINWGVWVVLFIFAISILAFWYISRRVSKTIIKPLMLLEKSTGEIISNKEISPVDSFVEIEHSTKEIKQLQKSFKKMWHDLYVSQSEKKKYEENRRELVANISHDLKTPMTSIIGYVEGLRDGVANTPEKTAAYINTIHDKSKVLNDMIDQLFLYSKLDIDSLELNTTRIDINRYMNNILDEYMIDDQVDIHVTTHNNPIYVNIDTNQFDRVINNLVQNSIKFKGDNEKKVNIEVKISPLDDKVELSFSDNGIGISPTDIPYVFERFYRADKSRTPTVKGSGLGLSIVKQIVEHHHGTVHVTSQLNQGTTMYITLHIDKE